MTKNKTHTLKIALFAGIMSSSLVGCNGAEEQIRIAENDWIDTTVPDGSAPSPDTSTPNPGSTPAPSPNPTPTTDVSNLYSGPAEIARYVQKFVNDARIQGRDILADMKNPKLEIQFAGLDSYGASTIGLCETGSNRRRVTFDPDFWNAASETQKELLAHHEFGHCVLYRPHRSDMLSTGKYASIMYPIIMSSSIYTNNYDYYQGELFDYEALMTEAGAEMTHVCGPDIL